MKIHGWGAYPVEDAKLLYPATREDCLSILENQTYIPRGLGRSYGDSASAPLVIQSNFLNRIIHFDHIQGVLTCESGVSLKDLLCLIVPSGWFLPVTPGTAFVTIGGAIASDVHGKNHHLSGCFSECLISFDLLLGTGEIVTVSRSQHPALFHATCGGMGLTGMVISASFRLIPITSSYMSQTTIRAHSIEELFEKLDAQSDSSYSVAWIDTLARGKNLGRSLLMLGEHLVTGDLSISLKTSKRWPIHMCAPFLNRYSIKAFNMLYYSQSKFEPSGKQVSLESYFYPLDAIAGWNRLYGSRGFFQYQCVLPELVGVKGVRHLLNKISESQCGSFLAVLKKMGAANQNYLSFPLAGYTLALDFKRNDAAVDLLQELDAMVIDMGGRVYLSKDALMTQASFRSFYPRWNDFEEVRSQYGAIGVWASNQSKRLGLL